MQIQCTVVFYVCFMEQNKRPMDFEQLYQGEGYALNTLLNGNISHCIEYLRDLDKSGPTGSKVVAEELHLIANEAPDRYKYVSDKVFRYYDSRGQRKYF